MHADSMIDRSDSMGTIGKWLQDVSIGRVVVIALAVLMEALLILGFVAASLGVGNEGHPLVGPDRPPPPATYQRQPEVADVA